MVIREGDMVIRFDELREYMSGLNWDKLSSYTDRNTVNTEWTFESTPQRPPNLRWCLYREVWPPYNTTLGLYQDAYLDRPSWRATAVISWRAIHYMRGDRYRSLYTEVLHLMGRLLDLAVRAGYLTDEVAEAERRRWRDLSPNELMYRLNVGDYQPAEPRRMVYEPTDWTRDKDDKDTTERAKSLLEASLSKEQLAEFKDSNHFCVTAKSGRRYRINQGKVYNVSLVSKQGETIATYCAGPDGGLPTYDFMLAQKLLLEADEQRFLEIANKKEYPPERGWRV